MTQEESELRKLFEEQRQWEIERSRKRTKTLIIILGFVLLAALFVYSAMWMSDLQNRTKESMQEIEGYKARAARRAAEKFQQDFADSLQRVENQKKLEKYLKRNPSERAKIRKK